MMKKLHILLCAFIISSCTSHDEAYYRHHPEALKQAISDCGHVSNSDVSCQQLEAIAIDMNQYIYDLQTGPQAFGRGILSLQSTIAEQQQQLKTHPEDRILKSSIQMNMQSLSERLSIVRWLESPAS